MTNEEYLEDVRRLRQPLGKGMSSKEHEALRVQAQVQMVQQAEWAKPKPPTVEELRDENERLQLTVTELREDIHWLRVAVILVTIGLVVVVFVAG